MPGPRTEILETGTMSATREETEMGPHGDYQMVAGVSGKRSSKNCLAL